MLHLRKDQIFDVTEATEAPQTLYVLLKRDI